MSDHENDLLKEPDQLPQHEDLADNVTDQLSIKSDDPANNSGALVLIVKEQPLDWTKEMEMEAELLGDEVNALPQASFEPLEQQLEEDPLPRKTKEKKTASPSGQEVLKRVNIKDLPQIPRKKAHVEVVTRGTAQQAPRATPQPSNLAILTAINSHYVAYAQGQAVTNATVQELKKTIDTIKDQYEKFNQSQKERSNGSDATLKKYFDEVKDQFDVLKSRIPLPTVMEKKVDALTVAVNENTESAMKLDQWLSTKEENGLSSFINQPSFSAFQPTTVSYSSPPAIESPPAVHQGHSQGSIVGGSTTPTTSPGATSNISNQAPPESPSPRALEAKINSLPPPPYAIRGCGCCQTLNHRLVDCRNYPDGAARQREFFRQKRCLRCSEVHTSSQELCAYANRICRGCSTPDRHYFHLHGLCTVKYPTITLPSAAPKQQKQGRAGGGLVGPATMGPAVFAIDGPQ